MRTLLFYCLLLIPSLLLSTSPVAQGQPIGPPEQATTDEPATDETDGSAEENPETESQGDAENNEGTGDDDQEDGGDAEDNGTEESDNENASDAEVKMADPPKDVKEAVSTVWKSVSEMWNDFLARLPLFIVAFTVLVLTWFAAGLGKRLANRVLRNVHLRGSLKDLIKQMVYIGLWLSGLMVAAVVIFPGMTPAKVLTVLGLSSIAVGFAFKDIVENFFAGILILWGFPFENGDFIECGGMKGKVEETTIRMTTLRQTDGQLIIVPNAQLFKNPVYVITNQRYRRTTIIAGVAYDEDVDGCREIITKAVESCESVTDEKPIQIFAQEFGASSINFEVTWWTGSTPVAERKSRDEVVAAVKRALDDAGVEIPFPYRTLTFKEPLPIQKESAS